MVAGITGISSSAIVTKIVVELRRLSNPETPMILGIIVIEDLFLALYLAALAPVLGDASSAGEAIFLFVRALGFLVVLALAARYGAPIVQRLLGAREDELLVVLFFGLALTVAGAAEVLGVSEAIGAFMAGLLVGGTAVAPRVRKLVLPIRDAFAAVFFFAFGLAIDPSDIGGVALAAIVAALLSLVLAIVAGASPHASTDSTARAPPTSRSPCSRGASSRWSWSRWPPAPASTHGWLPLLRCT